MSNALDISYKTMMETFLLSIVWSNWSVTYNRAVFVEWSFLFPLWCTANLLFLIRYSISCLCTSLSAIFRLSTSWDRTVIVRDIWVTAFTKRCNFCCFPYTCKCVGNKSYSQCGQLLSVCWVDCMPRLFDTIPCHTLPLVVNIVQNLLSLLGHLQN